MAYHDDPTGFTPIIEGREYVRNLKYTMDRYKLVKYNPTTGICKLKMNHYVMFVSSTKLSNWHIMPASK